MRIRSSLNILPVVIALMLTGCSDGDSKSTDADQSDRNENAKIESHERRDAVWTSVQNAQRQAENSDKWVLIDVYTDWCGYCRQMQEETYTDERVLDRLEEYFYSARVNAESDEMMTFNGEEISMERFAADFGVTSYPTTIIVDSDGEPFAAQPGFIEPDMFTDILDFVGTGAYEETSFDNYVGN